MATQQDLQDLLRLLTGARKVPMLQAMTQVKALQAVNLRSIKQIAEAPLDTVESAIKEDKAARSLQNACKAAVKRGDMGTAPGKRVAASAADPPGASKRAKTDLAGADLLLGPSAPTPRALEASLALPTATDAARMATARLQTNRAPVVLAFAVELLRYTMPEQPLSSRLSLAQAVVAANSRAKAVGIGLERGPSAEEEGWGEGQPRVRVMGREVAVLKRGGYEWRGEEEVGLGGEMAEGAAVASEEAETQESVTEAAASRRQPAGSSWSASQPVSLKESTFIARATSITDPGQRQAIVRSLMETHPKLKTASHNAWAFRIRPPVGGSSAIREGSFDDGETGCGDLMLRIMREVNSVDTLVVLTRWFGGILLGPDRWRLMRNCVTSALAERLRKTGTEVAIGGEAVWGLDLEAMKGKTHGGGYGGGSKRYETAVVGMQIHRPEAARNYLLKSFATAPDSSQSGEGAAAGTDEGKEAGGQKSATTPKKRTVKAQDAEKEENLGLLLGVLRIVYDSWADHLTPAELDRRAWSWYVAVRPEVEHGRLGWGAKGVLKLSDILNLQRKESQ